MRVATALAAMALLTMAGLCTAAVTPKPSMTLAPKWITTTSGALAAQGGFIGVSPAGGNPTALALNASTGAVKFTFQLPIDTNTTGLQWMTCPQSINVAFLVALPGAVTATTSGVVFGVHALTGARLWSLPQEFAQFTDLLIACSPDGASTIVLTDAGVTAVATANGAYKWTAMVNGSAVLSSSFTVSSKDGKSTFFIFQDNNGIHRVDIATGVSKLLFPTAFVPDGSLQSPLGVTKDLIIMNGAFNVTAFDTDGVAVWALEELGQAVYGDLLLTKRSVPSLSAYNATSGKPLWFWQNLSTEVTGASILNILNAAPDGSIIALGTPVAPSINAGISGQVGKVLWTEVSPATAGTPVASTHYIVYPPSILAPPNATQWAVNIVTGEVRVLTGLASVNSVAEADGLLLVEGQQHTAAYAAW